MLYFIHTAYIDDDAQDYLDEGLVWGWLSPYGDYHPCGYGDHEIIEEDLREQYYGEEADCYLENQGWVRICHGGYLSNKPPTNEQWEFIIAHADRFSNEYTMDPKKAWFAPKTWKEELKLLHNKW